MPWVRICSSWLRIKVLDRGFHVNPYLRVVKIRVLISINLSVPWPSQLPIGNIFFFFFFKKKRREVLLVHQNLLGQPTVKSKSFMTLGYMVP